MAVLNAQSIIDHARILIRDTSSTKPKLSSTRMLSLANQIMYTWFTDVSPRYIETLLGTLASPVPYLASVSAYAEIYQVFRSSSGNTYYPPLKREKIGTIRRLLASDTRTGTPERYAITQDEGTAGNHEIWFHPFTDSTYAINGLIRSEPVAMVLTPSPSTPDVTPAESYWFAQILAARCAPIVGLPLDYIGELWRGVPQEVANKMRIELDAERPAPRPMGQVA